LHELPINRELTPELGTMGQLGDDAEQYGFVALAGGSPIALQVRPLVAGARYLLADHPDSELTELYKRFNLWLIPHSVSIIRRRGQYEPVYVGIEVQYETAGGTCSVRSLIPSAEFITHGQFRAHLGLHGELSPAIDEAIGTVVKQAIPGLQVRVDSGFKFQARVQANVITPHIAAVGLESDRCEWRFDRHDQPLFGKDLRTYTVVALSKWHTLLNYKIRYYIGVRKFILTRRIESDWVNVSCVLTDGAASERASPE
jgi:hypothetical protein